MDIIFTNHGRTRAKERNIDPLKLRRQLLSIPFDVSSGKVEWHIPKTNHCVVFVDVIESEKEIRKIVTIIAKTYREDVKQHIEHIEAYKSNAKIYENTLDYNRRAGANLKNSRKIRKFKPNHYK